ncbi:hypothetical protein JOF53_006455 [Crossiella equi]|uniref:Uncharacterized protein n=1 Tax=Crossiella equi TaxID=130796 RepID=A0ABS5ALZ1_9PSEU|nr:hypothetical protein [Crossiella equi]MBP2477583.1 hypothetical protein [Crossiella equi]
MARDLASYAQLDHITGDLKAHGNFWLNQAQDGQWHWIPVNPVHGTYRGGHCTTKVGTVPDTRELGSRFHGWFLLWARPQLADGQRLPHTDVEAIETALAALARHPQARLDPTNAEMVPVLDVCVRGQADGIHTWISARHDADEHEELRHLHPRLADPVLLARWAHRDGIAWGRPKDYLTHQELAEHGSTR